MTLITLDITKSVDENAGNYYEQAKKAKRKSKGVDKALAIFEKQRKNALKKSTEYHERKKIEAYVPQHWYEKFRWFTSSEGALCIGGRDATQNEILIKKQLDKDDLVFHTDVPGSPFFIVKAQGNTLTDATYEEVAIATLSYSKAWKLGLQSAEVFRVNADQVSKTAESGEYLTKGSFMIRGKREYYRPELGLAIANVDQSIIAGPEHAVKSQSDTYCRITPGNEKPSEAAKQARKLLSYTGHIDDLIRFMPTGKMKIQLKK